MSVSELKEKMSDFLKTDQGKYLAGLGFGVAIGMAIQNIRNKNSKNMPDIKMDHVVLNFTHSEEKFRAALQFWGKDGAGYSFYFKNFDSKHLNLSKTKLKFNFSKKKTRFDIIRMKEYCHFQNQTQAIRTKLGKPDLDACDYEGLSPPPAFPAVRVAEGELIDIFPPEMYPLQCVNNLKKQHPMDHMCITMDFESHVKAIQNLHVLGFYVIDHGKRFGGRGIGYSVYFHDPQGFWVEFRNYESNKWDETARIAEECMEKNAQGEDVYTCRLEH